MANFKPTKNRTSLISNEIVEKHRYNLSVNAQKVLLGLAQSVDHTIDMFPTVDIDINAFFEFLKIEHREDRWQVVRDAFREISKNPLEFSTEDAKRWAFIPWMSVEFDAEQSNYVKIQFTDKVKPFLLNLNGYVKLQGKYLVSLQSQYAMWLYPVMKMIQGKYYGQHTLPLERIMEITFTDSPKENPSYHDPKIGKTNFMKRVLGVQKDGSGYIVFEDGPLGQINKHTDINVSCEPLKNGRSIDRFHFIVESKTKTTTVERPRYGEVPEKKLPHVVSMKDVYALARETGKTVEQILKDTKRKISADGKWAISPNDEWSRDQRQRKLFDINGPFNQ